MNDFSSITIAYKKAINVTSSKAVYSANLSLACTQASNYAEAEKAMAQAVVFEWKW